MKQKEGQKYEKTEIRLCLDDLAAVYFYACFCCGTIDLYGRLKLAQPKEDMVLNGFLLLIITVRSLIRYI